MPPPRQLTLERQLHKSVLLGWTAADASAGEIDSYHVFVDGLLRCTVSVSEQCRALLEGVDLTRVSGGFSSCELGLEEGGGGIVSSFRWPVSAGQEMAFTCVVGDKLTYLYFFYICICIRVGICICVSVLTMYLRPPPCQRHRLTVRSVTPDGRTSAAAACTLAIGRDVAPAPTAVRATHVTATSAIIGWMPSNSNCQHTVCVNRVEVRTVAPGVHRHTIAGPCWTSGDGEGRESGLGNGCGPASCMEKLTSDRHGACSGDRNMVGEGENV